MASYTKADMHLMFLRGCMFASGLSEITPEDIAAAASSALREIQAAKVPKAKRYEDSVQKAWLEAGQPKDGVVINGIRHLPLPFAELAPPKTGK